MMKKEIEQFFNNENKPEEVAPKKDDSSNIEAYRPPNTSNTQLLCRNTWRTYNEWQAADRHVKKGETHKFRSYIGGMPLFNITQTEENADPDWDYYDDDPTMEDMLGPNW